MIGLVAGTFQILHEGHKNYIETGFRFCDFVYIVLATSKYANKKYKVKNINIRKEQIVKYLKSLNIEKDRYKFIKIDNEISLRNSISQNKINIAIVTPEYINFMRKINLETDSNYYILMIEKIKNSDGNDLNTIQLMENNNEM